MPKLTLENAQWRESRTGKGWNVNALGWVQRIDEDEKDLVLHFSVPKSSCHIENGKLCVMDTMVDTKLEEIAKRFQEEPLYIGMYCKEREKHAGLKSRGLPTPS